MNSTVFEILKHSRADPATREFPLFDSPWPTLTIVIAYLLFVLKLGPMYMKSRKPYNVKNVMLAYNIIQVLYNGLMFGCGIYHLFIRPLYNLSCMQNLAFDHPEKHMERCFTYAYFLNKLLDLMDTVFFVLRKSFKQITVLHVYHHSIMFYGFYWFIRFYGVGGQYTMMGFLNSFVHTVMYSYYFLSALYPGLKGSLWWKKYITRIQLLQFIVLFCQALIVMIFNPSCQFPVVMQYAQLAQATIFTFMFGNFYYHAYVKTAKAKKEM